MLRVGLFYVAAVLVLALYGIEVCPFLEELQPAELCATLAFYFALGFWLRQFLVKKRVTGSLVINQPRAVFWTDLGVFLAAATLLTIHNTVFYGFPLGSGVKLGLGCLAWGFFAGIDSALEWERQLVLNGISLPKGEFPQQHYCSLARTFSGVMVSGIILVYGIVVLVLIRDLHWISQIPAEKLLAAKQAVIVEIGFIAGFLLLLTLNLVYCYSRNLKMFFASESQALEEIALGNLEHYVPVTTRNEFGVIAGLTNSMIDQMREQNRIKQAFGKIVSPQVARRLLSQTEGGIRLGGSRREVTILVSDIYDFTSRAEKVSAEIIVGDLNSYFTEMVSIVHSHGGIVDKFIGDGMLAVFGLDNLTSAEVQAVHAAIEMQKAIVKLNQSLSSPIQVGIGLHRGSVIVGNIGSYERLEFTVIGDVVNVASRIEGLTRSLQQQLLVSDDLYQQLDQDLHLLPWQNCGEQVLRGKEKKLVVYGLNGIANAQASSSG